MRDRAADAAQMAKRRQAFLEKGYALFSTRNIESVSLQNVADAAGYGIATLYRYFTNKPNLVVEIAVWKWAEVLGQDMAQHRERIGALSAAESMRFYLDTFLRLYREHRDLLRFNQFFNFYIQAERIDADTIRPYLELIRGLEDRFHALYERGLQDGTLRTDVPEREMFSTTLHLMLAAVTRYAIGLVYRSGDSCEQERELMKLKELLLATYTCR